MRKFYLLLTVLFASLSAGAQQVTEEQALQKAQAFMKGKQLKSSTNVRSLSRARSKASQTESMYVFNVEDKGGFVIVSGDERTEPILGYSTSGEIDYDNMPDNLRSWLQGYEAQIRAISENPQLARRKTGSEKAAIEPMIQTHWEQQYPYNTQCPHDRENNGYCVTGCVATALAQIMYYYRWPETTTAIPAYETTTEHFSLEELPATSFKWDNMKTYYRYDEPQGSSEGYAVAELMRYCGQAMRMDYTRFSSGTSVDLAALSQYFGYSKNSKSISRNYYSTSEWEEVIYDELSLKRPVLYSGNGPSGSHEFLCDGYDGDGRFHINFGWGEEYDCYCVLSVIMTDRGSFETSSGYPLNHVATIGLIPDKTGEVATPHVRSYDTEFSHYFETLSYTRGGADTDFQNVELKGTLIVQYHELPSSSPKIEVGWGLFQNGVMLSCLGSEWKTLDTALTQELNFSKTVSFGAGLAEGTYQICMVYRLNQNDEWMISDNSSGFHIVATVNSSNLTIRNYAPYENDYAIYQVLTSLDPEAKMTVDVYLTNTGEGYSPKAYLWINKEGEWKLISNTGGYVDPGATGVITFLFAPEDGGVYEMKITSDSEGMNVKYYDNISIPHVVIVDGFKYALNPKDMTARVLRNGFSSVSELVIPSSVTYEDEQYTVTEIGDWAFYYYLNVVSLTIPNTVTSIGEYAFRQLISLPSVEIPEGVEYIGKNAFSDSWELKYVVLPSTLRSIGDNAFDNNNSATIVSHIAYPFGISDNVFGDLEGSMSVLFVPEGRKNDYKFTSGWGKFYRYYEGELHNTVVDGLNYLLETGTKSAIVTKGDYSNMESVDIPETIAAEDVTYTVRTIGEEAFYDQPLTAVTLPQTIETIERYAFYNTKISAIDLPEGLTTIEKMALTTEKEFEQLVLPSTLTSLCGSINANTVISRIRDLFEIPEGVFGIYDPDTETYKKNSKVTLFIPEGTITDYSSVNGWNLVEHIYQGEPKEAVVDGLRYWCATGENFAHVIRGDYANMEDVVIPPTVDIDGKSYTVTVIENHAFANYSIHSVTFPQTIDSIGRSAFEMTGLESLTLPSSLKSLGSRAFAFCQKLKTIDLPEGLETLMDQAFNGCISLEELELPSTLTCIESSAFSLLHSLKKITSHIVNPFPINEYTFTMRTEDGGYKWMESTILYVPIGSLEKYQTTDGWKNFANIFEGELKEVKIGDLTYSYLTSANTVKVTGWNHKHDFDFDTVEIPEKVTIGEEEYTVTEIADFAFSYSTNLKSLVLPSTLKVIGINAFYDNGIREVMIPEGVTTVSNGAFNRSYNLEKVVLPSSLTTIGSYAFRNPNKEKAMVICNLTEPIYLDEESFDFDVSTLYVGQGLKETFMNAEGWKLFSEITDSAPDETKEVTIDGLKYTYKTASKTATIVKGDYKEMTSVTIPPSIAVEGETYTVKSIENGAFYECENLTAVNISDLSAWCNMTMDSNPLEYAHHLYLDGKEIKDLVIPDDVTYVGKGTFKGCTGLISLTIPGNVKTVEENAFYQCYEVSNITLSDGLETIEPYAFYGCYPDELVIPEGVKSIGERAFYGLSLPTVKHLVLPSTLTSIGEYAFFMVSSFNSMATVVSHIQEPFEITEGMFGQRNVITVPEGCTEAYLATKGWNNVLDVLEGDMSIDKVGSLYYLHSTLSDNAIVWKGDYQYVRTVTIPASVTIEGKTYTVNKMGRDLFGGNNKIANLNLPSTIETIPAKAFAYCSGLKTVTIPQGVKRIEESAFEWCTGLKHVELPASLEYLGENAFEGCQELTEVVSHNYEPFPFDYNVFPIYYVWNDTKQDYELKAPTLYVPFGTADVYKSTNGWDGFNPIEEMEEVLYDVNKDDVLDANDVVDVIKFIAGKNPGKVTSESADVNEDGKVDVADVIFLSQAILSKKKQ